MPTILNPEQKAAVTHRGGPLLIIAGAGTGKTTVITERIKWLIEKQNLSPEQIVALTFTEKAAREMEERVDLALPLGYSQLWISTFHSFADHLLRDEGLQIGLDPDFKLLSEAESVLFLKERFFELKLDYFRPAGNPYKFLRGLIRHFSRLRDEDISSRAYLAFARKQSARAKGKADLLEAKKIMELAQAYQQYQQWKLTAARLDFADLISLTLQLFRRRPNVLAEYRRRWRYFLVDEFQDTNIAQYELIKLLAPPDAAAPLTVAGDDSQSIYKFRGAAISNILAFRDDYPQSKMVVLTKNYRSSQIILDQAYRLIKHNDPDTLETKLGISKNLRAQRQAKNIPIQFSFPGRGEEEADLTAKEINRLCRRSYQYRDIAILVRANNHADPFIHAFQRYHIPYQFLGPGQLFHQPEIKDLIAYLLFLYDPTNNTALFRVLSMPHLNISGRDLALIRSFSHRYNLDLFEALEALQNPDGKRSTPHLTPAGQEAIKNILPMVYRHLDRSRHESGGQILYYFLQDSELIKTLLDPKTETDHQKGLNIAKFFDKIKKFESNNRGSQLEDLVAWINLKMELGESPLAAETDWSDNNAVNILSVHSAKGLEFPVVFIVNLVNQRFPTNRRREQIPIPQPLIKETLPQGDPHQEEERRLFYVGMTRARDRLYFSGAKFYGEGKLAKKPSIFVTESLGKTPSLKTGQASAQLTFLDWSQPEKAAKPVNLNSPVSYLSYSRIDAFSICPRQYKYKYVLYLPTPPSAAQTFGNIIHKTLKIFYRRQLEKEKPFRQQDILDILRENWSSEGFRSKKEEKINYGKAQKMLRRFYRQSFKPQQVGNILALEQPFSFHLNPTLKIGGVIDRVDRLENGEIEIIDYKTGSRLPEQKDVDHNDQLTLYALAASQIKSLPFSRPIGKIKLSLHFLNAGIRISSYRNRQQLEDFKKKIINLAAELEKTDFRPKPNRPFPCDYCEFRLLCDAWR